VYRFNEEIGEFSGIGETAEPGFVDPEAGDFVGRVDSLSYVVTAFSGDLEGQATNAVIVTLEEPEPRLPAPEWIGVGERAGPGRQELRWTPVEGADAYLVERFDEAAGWERVARPGEPGWQRREWAARRTFRVVALSGGRRGEPSHAVVMGSMPVAEEEFGDRAYRDEEWERHRSRSLMDRADDRLISRSDRTVYEGSFEDRDLFDFEEIQSFFEEALQAEREAFRKYRQQEERAFEEFLESERDR
jgi:hypothetical protein